MSEALDRIPRLRAEDAARRLMAELGIDPARSLIAGSIRRELATVGDIELVVPMPDTPGIDPLFEHIAAKFTLPGVQPARTTAPEAALWGEPAPAPVAIAAGPRLGHAIKGAKPGFRYCQLALQLTADPRAVVNVDIFRYDDGDQGNRGWIELIRTGPGDFGKAALQRWKSISNGGKSEGGYPHRPDGTRIPVPTERAAFELLGWAWVPPKARR